MLVMALTTSVSATVCVNANKVDDAGKIGDVTFHLDGTVTIVFTNPGEQLAGGFVDLYGEFDIDGDGVADGTVKFADDVYILDVKRRLAAGLPVPELPDGAHLAAGCEQGVDDLVTCSLP